MTLDPSTTAAISKVYEPAVTPVKVTGKVKVCSTERSNDPVIAGGSVTDTPAGTSTPARPTEL
jgi:hypothetical protein